MTKTALIGLALVVTACAGSGSGGGGGGLFGDDGGGDDDGGREGGGSGSGSGSTSGSELLGTWSFTSCGNGSTGGAKISVIIADGRFDWTRQYYQSTDTTCAKPFAVERFVDDYTVVGDSAVTQGAKKIDFVTAASTLMVADSTVASNWNSASYCGYSNWVVNVPKEVSGDTCANTGGNVQYEEIGYPFFDIYKVDSAKLYMGDSSTGPGTSDATRPTVLTTGYYSKQ